MTAKRRTTPQVDDQAPAGGPATDDGGRPLVDDGGRIIVIDPTPDADQ